MPGQAAFCQAGLASREHVVERCLQVGTGSAADEAADASFRLPVPEAPLAVLSPLLSVVPGQVFTVALSRANGLNADQPTGLTKITLAQ